MRTQPHHISPAKSTIRVAIAYKNFASNKGISHIGLGVAALNTMRSLRAAGIWCEVWPVNSPADIETRLAAAQGSAPTLEHPPVSHVVISAPWIQTTDMQGLLMRHPEVHFAVVSHSNVGFLMADPSGIRLLREGMDLSIGHHNFVVAGNCQRFVDSWSAMYGRGMQCLPNLYDVSTIRAVGQRVPWNPGSPIRIGVFGATRPLKNMVSAAAACVELASMMRADVEIWMNTGRTEGGGTVHDAVKQLVDKLPRCQVKESGWQAWPAFRQVVGSMNLLISPSYTESFNMVTADGAAEGVASVVSDAVDWAPSDWRAAADDVGAIARVGRRLLSDPHAVTEGQDALRAYVARGLPMWQQYLLGS